MPPKNPRLSLTNAQIQTGIGAELLTLCQTVTADGVLTNEEIGELRLWLETNRANDLPAIGFLVATVERILADGIVTPDERKELYAAIEKVLPPEARREATAQRKAVAAAEKERERAVRERQRPIYFLNFMVAGVHYEGRPEVIRRYAQEDDRVFLARDRDNKFSRNAVEVRLANGYQIGFVPEDYAPEVAPLLDGGAPHTAHITKMLRNARVPIPVVHAYLYRTDAGAEGMTFPRDVPAKKRYRSERRESERDEVVFEPPARRPAATGGKGCLLLLPLVCGPAAVLAARALGLSG